MDLSTIVRRAGKLISDNSPAILTASAVVGTVATAYLTGRATVKAVEMIHHDIIEQKAEIALRTPSERYFRTYRENVELVWQLYIPAVTTGVATIAFIIAANRVGARRTAAAMAAFALSEKALDEYKDKVVERIGKNKEQKIRDEIAQDHVTKHPAPADIVLHEGGLSVLCCDLFTGRYFVSDMQTLRSVENDINHQIIGDMYVSLSEFYDAIGLEKTSMSDDFGWNLDKLLELEFSTALTPSGKPCLTMNFRVAPIRGFHRLQ